MVHLYDTIGVNYAELRKPEPRIGSMIRAQLRGAESVVNVGAGAGSYEPEGAEVVAVEPSSEMIQKRTVNAAPVVQAVASSLPFSDDCFDASMAILTVHHWPDKLAGIAEMRRVTRGLIVVMTFDPSQRPWLTDYLPELATLDEDQMPSMEDFERWLGDVETVPVPLPHDCSDGFLHAYWRRPEAYLDARVRSGISSFWRLRNCDAGLQKLKEDLKTGLWHRRYAKLLDQATYDAGYRLIVGTSAINNSLGR